MAEFLIGAGVVLALSFVACLLDRDTRRDVKEIVGAVLFAPTYTLIVLALWVSRKLGKGRVYRVSPRGMRYFANNIEARGWIVDRPARSFLVITRTEPQEKTP